MTTMTSREFNQNTAAAKRAADEGPVYITDRGRRTHVLVTYEAYERVRDTRTLAEVLAGPEDVSGIELELPERAAHVPRDLGLD